ncbi:conserved hypothetical protein [Planctopirus limnophila DSM 3776]|uniref:DUF1819 domain-containing protein n=1 Tax=Planctopirus limnophila (strain ATCC 43296 / DSM 3776 / IFAM 1008 / Mu 290) TaxID=521674 RepID=D5SSV0_PLAL2|nr:BrxA family protein [Planctopirus limnophila]ADG68901.1 conserved hypothetical protein [Planctopirus limnophila DSM 3776]
MPRPSETTAFHTRLLKCSLEVEHCRAYWHRVAEAADDTITQIAFKEYWFGARSLPRVTRLINDFRHRFDQFPPAMSILHRWGTMDSSTRRLICHWHLQLADRLYREFTGGFLVDRYSAGRTEMTRDVVVRWIDHSAPQRWTTATRIQFARKLLFSAGEAGILKGTRDPREWQAPRVTDEALSYILYLLREIQFQGTLIDNPYLASVGVTGPELERRSRTFPDCPLRRQGELFEFSWRYKDLAEWAEARILHGESQLRETA